MAGWYRHSVGPGRLEHAKRAWYKRIFAGAAALVSWSEWARDSLAEHYDVDPARVLVAHPGAPSYLFDLPREAVDRKPRILFVGGDLARKGGDALLEAFAPLRDRAELTLMTEERVRPGEGVHVLRGVRPGMPAFREAFASGQPNLIDIRVADGFGS
jgi:glycosyltransferase involved in cell wall biosynthesis